MVSETGEPIGPDAVYLDDLNNQPSPSKSTRSTTSSPTKKKKYVSRDQYALPNLEGTLQSKALPSDPRLATEAELRDFIDEMRPEDFDIDSEFFANLPTEVKYEIVGDLRIKSRQANHKRVEAMRAAPTALDFSRAQIKNLMERNDLTQKLLTVTDAIAQANLTIPIRIASERNKEYVLIKNDVAQGGGWVLGVRDQPQETGPVKIDVTESEGEESSDTDEFEEVGVPVASVPFFRGVDPRTCVKLIKATNVGRALRLRTTTFVDIWLSRPSAIATRPRHPSPRPILSFNDLSHGAEHRSSSRKMICLPDQQNQLLHPHPHQMPQMC
jgi:hypothetical protein